MPLVNFVFPAEALQRAQEESQKAEPLSAAGGASFGGACVHGSAPTGGLLTGGGASERIEYVTDKSQYGIRWVPEWKTSVVYALADTFACWIGPCVPWQRLGCYRPVNRCGFSFYRQTFTRAWWIYMANFVAFFVHAYMTYLCIAACGAEWPNNNENCTEANMTVPIYRCASPAPA